MPPFYDLANFTFVEELEAAFADILAEVRALQAADFVDSPDSLTAIADGYDETGWRYFDLYGQGGDFEANRQQCPAAAAACAAVPGMINAGFSLFAAGTHLYPHRGELSGVLRCHLPLIVPAGDTGLRIEGETRVWQPGHCIIFDDTREHDAWNRTDGDRVVLLVTFAEPPPPTA